MSLFAYIKEHLSILDVITEFVTIKPAGHYWKGPCPFHAEKDASFTVSPDKQIFYCFGCHATGDVTAFIAKTENMNQLEAVHYLIDRYKLNVPESLLQGTQIHNKEEKDRYFKVCKAVAAWCHNYLLHQKHALGYVQQRNITDISISTFHVGYFPSGSMLSNTFIKELTKDGILLKDLIDCGIIQEGRLLYSPFEERILFPIKDSLGRFCGFGGRTFKQGDDRPKYYNSREADGFEKGKLLFGFHDAKKSLIDCGFGFLVEGYLDCIMMVQYDYKNTIATLGTACTAEHLKMLARYVHTLFVLYDGDHAGQKAMLRLTELCWQADLELKVITLPQGHDPASFLSEGNNLEPLVSQAVDIVTFFINSTGSNFSAKPLAHKLSIAEKITSLIARVSPAFKQDLLLHHTASVTQVPFSSLKELMHSTSNSRGNFLTENKTSLEDQREQAPIEALEKNSLLEEKIFSAILNNMHAYESFYVPEDVYNYFSTTGQYILTQLASFRQHNKDTLSFNGFLDTLDTTHRTWAARVSMRHDTSGCQTTFAHLLMQFYKLHWQKIVQDTKEQVIKAKQENNNQKVQEVLARFAQRKQEILLENRGLIR